MAGLLRSFRQQLAQITSPQVRHDLAVQASREIAHQIQEGFDEERDPYGVPWIPSKKATGKTLTKSGALRSSLLVESDASGKRVVVRIVGPAKRYGPVHQEGRGRMPRRRFMPDDSGLPPAWAQALRTLSDAYFDRRWGR